MWAQCNHKGPLNVEEGEKKSVSAWRRLRKAIPAIAGFEDERGPQDKERG